MSHYKDSKGRDRIVEINIDDIERVRSRCGVDLYNMLSLSQASAEVTRILRVIYEIQSPSDESFADWFKAHKGDGQSNAISAFVDELCDFFPSRLGEPLRQAMRDIEAKIDAVFADFDATFIGSPGSSGSIPAF